MVQQIKNKGIWLTGGRYCGPPVIRISDPINDPRQYPPNATYLLEPSDQRARRGEVEQAITRRTVPTGRKKARVGNQLELAFAKSLRRFRSIR